MENHHCVGDPTSVSAHPIPNSKLQKKQISFILWNESLVALKEDRNVCTHLGTKFQTVKVLRKATVIPNHTKSIQPRSFQVKGIQIG
jgi:hypothetical protein